MKLIIAYIPMGFLGPISSELEKQHIHGMMVSTSHSFGQEHEGRHFDHREFAGIERTKKLRIEIACHDSETDRILDTIYAVAHTGLHSNGCVFVLPILEALRLKTGERGCKAVGPPQSGLDPIPAHATNIPFVPKQNHSHKPQ